MDEQCSYWAATNKCVVEDDNDEEDDDEDDDEEDDEEEDYKYGGKLCTGLSNLSLA